MPRPIRIEGAIAYVQLTQGYEAVIDSADVPLVCEWNWTAHVVRNAAGKIRAVYARRNDQKGGEQRLVSMHRVIASTPYGMVTDHIDGDGLNNRRSNLRAATIAQNCANQRLKISNSSGVKGVSWHKSRGKWAAAITINRTTKCLGYYSRIEDAAAAYAQASANCHAEFGRIQ